jgi:hypothetical protein
MNGARLTDILLWAFAFVFLVATTILLWCVLPFVLIVRVPR